MEGDFINISPTFPFLTSLLFSSQIIILVKGFEGFPVDPGFFMYSSPEITAPAAFVSVKPYPKPGLASGNSSLKLNTCDEGLAAPPPDRSFSEDRLYFFLSGCLIISKVIVGTPLKLIIFSLSMIFNALDGSHLYSITIFLPDKNESIN